MLETIAPLGGIKDLVSHPEPPGLGPGPRAKVQPLAGLNQKIDRALRTLRPGPVQPDLLRATILLWHDHLDAAHTLSQSIETADGSYVHGLMHRREPDYGNAKYWFRRVGSHPCLAELATEAAVLFRAAKEDALESQLIPRGQWDSFAFIDACKQVAGRPATNARVVLLRAVQGAEFEILLRHFVGDSGGR